MTIDKEDGSQSAAMVAGVVREETWTNHHVYYRTLPGKGWIGGRLNKIPRLSQDLLDKAASLGNLFT